MKKTAFLKFAYFIAGLVLIVVFSAFLINRNMKSPAVSGPAIHFNEERFDFGDVKQGPAAEHIFEFTNVGEGTLVIKNVSTSCGCTGAMVGEKKDYLPGESGQIKVTFNTQGRTGKFEKTVTVETNDAKAPSKTLTIVCNVFAP